jgi:Na+-transporting methylmalonyl-CoA/oxaloacetate decarboxylase gamma subunit
MEQILDYFIKSDSNIEKGVFLMIAGVLFVFAVQTVFYVTVKIWARKKK